MSGGAVPLDFLGINYMEYPVAGNSPAGLLSWKSIRLSQQPETFWSSIETSPGVYNATVLANLDAIITFQRQNGVAVTFGMYGTPTFYASSSPNPTYGDNVTVAPWGKLGGGAHPTSLAAVTNFVTMLINRYNKPGGAWYDVHGAVLGKGIQRWDVWNEPYVTTSTSTNSNTTGIGGSGAGFYWGSVNQLVDFCYTQFAAIKAVDASVEVLSPGFSASKYGPPVSAVANAFFSAIGPITGMSGKDSCDTLAWHMYGNMPQNSSFENWTESLLTNATSGLQATLASLNPGWNMKPWRIDEWGVSVLGSGQTVLDWLAAPALTRYRCVARTFMQIAALGGKAVSPWAWYDQSPSHSNSGNWHDDTQGVQRAYNDCAAILIGKTIQQCTIAEDGTTSLIFSDGSSWIV